MSAVWLLLPADGGAHQARQQSHLGQEDQVGPDVRTLWRLQDTHFKLFLYKKEGSESCGKLIIEHIDISCWFVMERNRHRRLDLLLGIPRNYINIRGFVILTI